MTAALDCVIPARMAAARAGSRVCAIFADRPALTDAFDTPA